MSTPRTHFAAANGGPLLLGVCGHSASGIARLTDEPHGVTCRACRKVMGRAAIYNEASMQEFAPGAPYETRRQRWHDRGPAIVRRSIDGIDAPRPDGWSSLDAALRAWSSVRHASPVASSSSYGDGAGRSDREPVAMVRVGDVVPVERVISRACASGRVFAGDADGRGALVLSSADVRFVVELYIAGRGAADISSRLASRLRLDDSQVTETQMGIVWREARRVMQAYLEERQLVPRLRQTSAAKNGSTEESMAHLPNHDLEGVKEIASYLGLSERTVMRLISRDSNSNPLRVARYLGTIYASKADVDQWRLREMKAT